MVPEALNSLFAPGGFIPPLYLPSLADPTPLTRRKRFRYWRRGVVVRARERGGAHDCTVARTTRRLVAANKLALPGWTLYNRGRFPLRACARMPDDGPPTPEQQDAFLDMIEEGKRRDIAAAAVGSTGTRFRRLYVNNETFARHYDKALQMGALAIEDQIRQEVLDNRAMARGDPQSGRLSVQARGRVVPAGVREAPRAPPATRARSFTATST